MRRPRESGIGYPGFSGNRAGAERARRLPSAIPPMDALAQAVGHVGGCVSDRSVEGKNETTADAVDFETPVRVGRLLRRVGIGDM